ncbi:MAG: RNase adapter RapZ [Clostridia bacterium]|nr:RNase adapter RapZ [Clostridia bacterium]
MKFLIITGISGAGKTQVLHFLEDMGYYCIDNMPVLFLSSFAQAVAEGKIKAKNVAVVTDIRGGEMFSNIDEELSKISKKECPYEIVFLEADDTALVRRYKETRRAHPLAPHGPVEKGINSEREIMAKIRQKADHVINTSNLLTRELNEIVREKFGEEGKKKDFFSVNIMSFGFKYGIPNSTDLVMDVRFLPNPYYVEDMRYRTGLEEDVFKYVTENEACREFVKKYTDMIMYLVPHYIRDGRRQVTISIGCTGGKHRSVAITEELRRVFEENGISAKSSHRDIERK